MENGGAPTDSKNSTTSSYRINGEVSDYMLTNNNIYAISPYIGSSNIFT